MAARGYPFSLAGVIRGLAAVVVNSYTLIGP